MPANGKENRKIRVLLSEGSSTNVREMITALGPLGYTLDICDPNPLCLGRFSRYIGKVYRCPVSGKDPIGYLKRIIHLLEAEKYDVLFPANEQAYLFSWAKDQLTRRVGLAVADFTAFNRVQTKSAFLGFLDDLEITHPVTRYAHTWSKIVQAVGDFRLPFFLKTDYGTASTGVWRIEDDRQFTDVQSRLEELELLDGRTRFLIQEAAGGKFEQAHSIFDRGRLLALHCTRRLSEGVGGGAILKIGVERPEVRRHFEKIGEQLSWHGSLSIDYFWDEKDGRPSYIDANPRITEPMNAVVNGINLADMQVRLSLGEKIEPLSVSSTGLKSHSAIQAVMGAAARRKSRSDLLKEICLIARRKGDYAESREGMTPIAQDFPAILPLAGVILNLLIDPRSGQDLACKTIQDYSLGAAIPGLSALNRAGLT